MLKTVKTINSDFHDLDLRNDVDHKIDIVSKIVINCFCFDLDIYDQDIAVNIYPEFELILFMAGPEFLPPKCNPDPENKHFA